MHQVHFIVQNLQYAGMKFARKNARGANASSKNTRSTNARGTRNARETRNARLADARGTNIKMLIWRQITGTLPREKMAKGMYARKTFARMSNVKRCM